MIDSQGFLAIKERFKYASLLLGAEGNGFFLVLSVLRFVGLLERKILCFRCSTQ